MNLLLASLNILRPRFFSEKRKKGEIWKYL
jgi:hypothetical protein